MEPRKDEIEIDVGELFFVVIHKAWVILMVGVLTAAAAMLCSKIFLTPIYTSTSSVYVISRQNEEKTTLADLQTGSQLTKDYKILVKSRPVTEQVISDLGLDMTYNELAHMITVDTPAERILTITVKNPDAYMAKQLSDAIADVSAERMVSVMEMEKVNIVESGNLPTEPSSPNVRKNAMIGGIAGIALSVIVIILVYVFNDAIKDSEDVEQYLQLTTLGLIPLEEGTKKKKNRKRQSKESRLILNRERIECSE